MQIGMCRIPFKTAELFRAACKGDGLTRSALARGLCEREGWRGGGRLCLASARKLLPRLAGELDVRLSETKATDLEPHARPAPDFADRAVSCRLAALGALSLEPAASADERRRWEAMIETHHQQGWRRLPSCGRRGRRTCRRWRRARRTMNSGTRAWPGTSTWPRGGLQSPHRGP